MPVRLRLLLAGAACVGLPALAQTWQVPKPSPGLMPNPTVGKALYEKNCAACHGVSLDGTDKEPPFLHRVYVPSHHWKFGDMQPVPAVSADDVAHITAYVRLRQRQAGIQ